MSNREENHVEANSTAIRQAALNQNDSLTLVADIVSFCRYNLPEIIINHKFLYLSQILGESNKCVHLQD